MADEVKCKEYHRLENLTWISDIKPEVNIDLLCNVFYLFPICDFSFNFHRLKRLT